MAASSLHASNHTIPKELTERMDAVLSLQEKWHQHTQDAIESGFYIEASTISLSQIHIVLRWCIWIETRLSLIDNPGAQVHFPNDFWSIPDHMIPDDVSDGELLGAAEKLGIVDVETGQVLTQFLQEVPLLLRDIVAEPEGNGNTLSIIADELHALAGDCIEFLRLELQYAPSETQPN